jgi:hypothetical protein
MTSVLICCCQAVDVSVDIDSVTSATAAAMPDTVAVLRNQYRYSLQSALAFYC